MTETTERLESAANTATDKSDAPVKRKVHQEAVPRVRHPFRLQWEQAQNAYVLLYPEGMVKLNYSAGHILSRCDGHNTVGAVIVELSQAFPDADNIDQDILEFLADAQDQGWIGYD